MYKSSFSIDSNILSKLQEVVDKNNQTICLLPSKDIIAQNLFHRTVTVVIYDNLSRILLRRNSENCFDLSSWSILPAGQNPYEFCESLIEQDWEISPATPQKVHIQEPCIENQNSFMYVFTLRVSNKTAEYLARDREKFLLVDNIDIKALQNREFPFSPLLSKIIDVLKISIRGFCSE